MLDKVKIYLGITDTIKDDLLEVLIEDAINEVVAYCNLKQYDEKLDSTVIKMVLSNYNKLGSEGIDSHSYSGVSESFADGYSKDIVTMLNKHRRVRML